MLTLIVTGLFGLTIIFDFVPGIKQRPKKESVLYCLLLAFGFIVLLLFSLDVNVPGPTVFISNVVKALVPIK